MKTVGMGTEKKISTTENDSELRAAFEGLVTENEALNLRKGVLEEKIEELIAENEALKEVKAEKQKK